MNAIDAAICLVAAYGSWVEGCDLQGKRGRRAPAAKRRDTTYKHWPDHVHTTTSTISPSWDVRYGYAEPTYQTASEIIRGWYKNGKEGYR